VGRLAEEGSKPCTGGCATTLTKREVGYFPTRSDPTSGAEDGSLTRRCPQRAYYLPLPQGRLRERGGWPNRAEGRYGGADILTQREVGYPPRRHLLLRRGCGDGQTYYLPLPLRD